jgi:CheY-like chemotaxis protein
MMNTEPWGLHGRRWRWFTSISRGRATLPHSMRGSSYVQRTLPRMPRTPRESDDEAKAVGDSPAVEPQEVFVLVAEDEETIAETLAMIVEDSGYVALIAHDGRTALALARQHHPRLIITDLMMPFLSGAELVAAIHSDAATVGIVAPPVVVVTAASLALADEVGADAVIAKPFDVRNIEAAIQRLLENDDHR